MKNFFLGLMVCTMMLCIPAVSFGSDGAPTNKAPDDLVLVDNHDVSTDLTVIATPTIDLTIDIGYNSDISYCSSYDNMLTTHLVPPLEDTMDDAYHDCSYINYYNSLTATAPAPRKSEGYPSNHVGKLISYSNEKSKLPPINRDNRKMAPFQLE